jgi:NTE family protein
MEIPMNRISHRLTNRMLLIRIICLGLLVITRDFVGQEMKGSESVGRAGEATSGHFKLVPSGRKSIGVALEGGGALGLAHVGVLKWMQAHQVPIDRVAGTSMGALVGSLFASGYSSTEIERLVSNGNFDDLFSLKVTLRNVSFRRREDRDYLPQALTFGLRNGKLSLGEALIADDQLNAFLAHELVSYNAENLSFDDLPIPFRCVATDLTTLRPAIFRSGPLPFAVRASI